MLYEQTEKHRPLTIVTTNGDIDVTNGGDTPLYLHIAMARYNMSIAHEAVSNDPDYFLTHRLDITPDEFSPEYDHIGSCMYRCALCTTTFRTKNVYYKCPHCDFRFDQNLVDHTVTSMIADVCDRKFIFDGVQYAPDNTYMRKQIETIEKANAVLSRTYRDIDEGVLTEEDMRESIQRHNDTIAAATSALNTNLSHSTILNVPDDIPDKRTFFDADPQTQREIINTLATIRITTTNNPKMSRDYFKPKYVTFDWKVAE